MPLLNALVGASGGRVADGIISAHPIMNHNALHQSGSHQTPVPNPQDTRGEGMRRTYRRAVGTRRKP